MVEYVIGVMEGGYKALYDEQGNNVLGDNIVSYGGMKNFQIFWVVMRWSLQCMADKII